MAAEQQLSAAEEAAATVDAMDLTDAVDGEDAAAAKKREENRKKRERQKKKKATDKAGGCAEEKAGDCGPGIAGRWQTGKLPGARAERRESGGGSRGLGVFATQCLCAGEQVASAAPALSCVFDAAAQTVCSFCFAEPPPGATTEHTVTLSTGEAGFGLKLDDAPAAPPTGGAADGEAAAMEPIITMVTKESPNRDAVHIGDRVVSIDGVAVAGGHAAAVPKLVDGAARNNGSVTCVVRRPALLVCQGCHKLAACASCVADGCLAWHAYECALYRALPPQATKGETATLRLLLRYKVATEPKIGDWPSARKEPVGLLTSLQGNACDVPPDQLQQLSKLTAVPAASVASLIYQVRTNACEISRGGRKVGCALSVLMGWHNHECSPNARAEIGADGCVQISTLKPIDEAGELTISYVDTAAPCDERRKTLQAHYGFECRCTRCVAEQRKELKSKMHSRDQYLQAQRR